MEIFADVFTKVGRDLCFSIKPLNWQVASFATDRLYVGKELERAGGQKIIFAAVKTNLSKLLL